jgi:ATP-binding cassette subfamily B protein
MDKSGNRVGKGAETKAGLFSVVGPYWGIVIILIIMALAGSAINLLIPGIIARAIDAFSAGSFKAGIVIAEFLAAATGIFIFTFLQGVLQTITAERVAKDLRKSLAEKLSDQTYSFIIKSNPSKLLTNLTSDMDSVKMFVSQAFVTIISSLFVIIGASVLLIMINWKLALAVLVIVPVIATAFIIVFRKVRVIFRKSREVIDALNRIINESILGAALIRVLNSQQPENQKFLEKNMESRDLGLSIVRLF